MGRAGAGEVLLENPRVNALTRTILGAAIDVHRVLGPGLLESVYGTCLQYELASRTLRFFVQRPVPIRYKDILLDATYRIDLIVEDTVVVEIKAVETLLPVHQAQVLTYLKLTECPVGLLINFNVPKLMDGVRRLVRPGSI